MTRDRKIRLAFEFLRERARAKEGFSISELSDACQWTSENTKTNISKRLSEFILRSGKKLTVSPLILSVNYERFLGLFKQKNILFGGKYIDCINPHFSIFDFFLPLSLEDIMKQRLDNLFYKDSVIAGFRTINIKKLRTLTGNKNDSYESLIEKCSIYIGKKITGYSISQVNGRFRASELMEKQQAFNYTEHGDRYIIDETTAVIRFIIPHYFQSYSIDINGQRKLIDEHVPFASLSLGKEIAFTRFLFRNLFVNAIISVITSQDEIWLLETGSFSQLTRLKAQGRIN
jgi:hypothetical protein